MIKAHYGHISQLNNIAKNALQPKLTIDQSIPKQGETINISYLPLYSIKFSLKLATYIDHAGEDCADTDIINNRPQGYKLLDTVKNIINHDTFYILAKEYSDNIQYWDTVAKPLYDQLDIEYSNDSKGLNHDMAGVKARGFYKKFINDNPKKEPYFALKTLKAGVLKALEEAVRQNDDLLDQTHFDFIVNHFNLKPKTPKPESKAE